MISLLLGIALESASRDVIVLAAASLRNPFLEMERVFEAKNPGLDLKCSFAGSQELATQIVMGAPADAFFSADRKQMDLAVKSGRIPERWVRPFASNDLCLLVAKRAVGKIKKVDDLSHDGLKLSLACDKVPAGNYTIQMLRNASAKLGEVWLAKVISNVVSRETSAAMVVARIEMGEADAGVVYETDANGVRNASKRPIPADWNVIARYFLGAIGDGGNPEGGQKLSAFVLSREGQLILRKHGFSAAR
ncbi:MAG TPA: molybdate ABC transporter substrate-binding protein [Fimbriimonadaceae bacterium]|nr:molybdate ABC transporter substrate-binding protein [Fimbriimonadaceae bacterium]